jgi:hypothetical protein
MMIPFGLVGLATLTPRSLHTGILAIYLIRAPHSEYRPAVRAIVVDGLVHHWQSGRPSCPLKVINPFTVCFLPFLYQLCHALTAATVPTTINANIRPK